MISADTNKIRNNHHALNKLHQSIFLGGQYFY